MGGTIVVTVRGHWISGWFLRLAARAVVVVDHQEHAARWGKPTAVAVGAGSHTVAAGARYRGTPWLLGIQEREVKVAEGASVRVDARNGALNSEPFYLVTSA